MTNEYDPNTPLDPLGELPQPLENPGGEAGAPLPPDGSYPDPQQPKNHHTILKIVIVVLLILLALTSCLCWGRMGSIGTGGPVDPSVSLPGDTVVIDPGPAVSPTPSPSPSASPSPSPRPARRRPKASPTPLPALSPLPTAAPQPEEGGSAFRVTFYLNYPGAPGGAYAAINVPAGGLCTMPATPSRQDAFFDGWNTRPDGSGLYFDGTAPVTGELTLYAQWLSSPFDVADGSNPSWNEISSGGKPAQVDLFRNNQAYNNMIITNERYGIIAPGSSGAYELNVVNGSRADCEYLVQLVETLPQQSGGSPFLTFKLLRGGTLHKTTDPQGNEHFTVTGGSYVAGSASQYVSAADVNKAFSQYEPLAASSASLRTTHSYILLWTWPYENSAGDGQDTALGEAAAKGLLENYLLQITVEGRLKTS